MTTIVGVTIRSTLLLLAIRRLLVLGGRVRACAVFLLLLPLLLLLLIHCLLSCLFLSLLLLGILLLLCL